MKSFAMLGLIGLGLAGLGAWVGGSAAAVGGLVALAAQLAAVALLRPAMQAPQPLFFARWASGMGIRALALGLLLLAVITRRDLLPPLATTLGFLGVLLPLLFLETKFLR
ncbi:MAG TPA: hypothetical protein VMH88_11740 [Gemmatimonadales bacterium]|nr:hypothetical protein [Gemmatimonadales bacterium]